MKKISYAAMLFSCLYLATSCNSNQPAQKEDSVEQAEDINEAKNLNEKDAQFVTETADMGMREVELSKVAVEKATNADVKSFAQKMVEDHSAKNDELKGLAAKKQISIPTEMSNDTKDAIEGLNKKSGWDFDMEYIDKMVSDHKDAVDKFDNASKDAADNDLKTWAANTLPALRMHLEMAMKNQDMLKAMKSGKKMNMPAK
jgi:putative membrane protein